MTFLNFGSPGGALLPLALCHRQYGTETVRRCGDCQLPAVIGLSFVSFRDKTLTFLPPGEDDAGAAACVDGPAAGDAAFAPGGDATGADRDGEGSEGGGSVASSEDSADDTSESDSSTGSCCSWCCMAAAAAAAEERRVEGMLRVLCPRRMTKYMVGKRGEN